MTAAPEIAPACGRCAHWNAVPTLKHVKNDKGASVAVRMNGWCQVDVTEENLIPETLKLRRHDEACPRFERAKMVLLPKES